MTQTNILRFNPSSSTTFDTLTGSCQQELLKINGGFSQTKRPFHWPIHTAKDITGNTANKKNYCNSNHLLATATWKNLNMRNAWWPVCWRCPQLYPGSSRVENVRYGLLGLALMTTKERTFGDEWHICPSSNYVKAEKKTNICANPITII